MTATADLPDALLREHYARTCLSLIGMSYESAIQIPTIHRTLTRAAQESQRREAAAAKPLGLHLNSKDSE